jgi:antitoxin component YwqK of YwqJK toxin-antitoxin module
MRYTGLISLIIFSFSLTLSGQSDTINQTDASGRKQGYWEKRAQDSVLIYQGHFKDNKPIGEMRRYYETGELKAIMHYNENCDYVKTCFYYDTGEVAGKGTYFRNVKDSLWTYYSYYSGTMTLTETYSKGVKQGMEKKYYSNGQVSEEIEWNNDSKNGVWNQFFDDGTAKLKSSYTNNKVNGPYTFYWPNGKIYIQGMFVDNKRDGKWVFYTDEGKVKWEINYVNGEADNEEEIIKQDQEFFRMVDENMGKFEEPTLEDVVPGGNVVY